MLEGHISKAFDGELAALHIRVLEMGGLVLDQVRQAQRIASIATVQNLYNLSNRSSEDVLEYSAANNIGFIPWFPLATGELAKPGSPLATVASEHGASPSQLALAWLLRRSPVMLPIPGTSTVGHVEENIAAAEIKLSDSEFQALEAAVR